MPSSPLSGKINKIIGYISILSFLHEPLFSYKLKSLSQTNENNPETFCLYLSDLFYSQNKRVVRMAAPKTI